jgi:hypothetical protein
VTVTTCSTNWHTCAASLGGGCCQNGAACGSSTSCITSGQSTSPSTTTATSASPTSTITTSLIAPVRPTGSSDSGDATIPSTLTTGTSLIAVCPSDFYFCSAYYRPGCCRIGRDCSTTNCPAAAASSTLVSNGVTILVPVGTSTGGSTYVTTALITGVATAASSYKAGTCPGGLQSCDASLGGGCCVGGYGCAASGCTANAAGYTGTVSKIAPNNAPGHQAEIIGCLGLGIGAFFGVVMLIL